MNLRAEVFQGLDLQQENLLNVFHRFRSQDGYMPLEIVEAMAQPLPPAAAESYGAVTFSKAFALEPTGRHLVTACLGTACHVGEGGQIA